MFRNKVMTKVLTKSALLVPYFVNVPNICWERT